MANEQRFCSAKCRVYAGRYGPHATVAYEKPNTEAEADTSIGAALRAADAFTPVHIADHKTVAAIRVHRKRADPNMWEVTMPSGSTVAATKIHEALIEHIQDLVALANKLGQAAGEPLHVLSTRRKR